MTNKATITKLEFEKKSWVRYEPTNIQIKFKEIKPLKIKQDEIKRLDYTDKNIDTVTSIEITQSEGSQGQGSNFFISIRVKFKNNIEIGFSFPHNIQNNNNVFSYGSPDKQNDYYLYDGVTLSLAEPKRERRPTVYENTRRLSQTLSNSIDAKSVLNYFYSKTISKLLIEDLKEFLENNKFIKKKKNFGLKRETSKRTKSGLPTPKYLTPAEVGKINTVTYEQLPAHQFQTGQSTDNGYAVTTVYEEAKGTGEGLYSETNFYYYPEFPLTEGYQELISQLKKEEEKVYTYKPSKGDPPPKNVELDKMRKSFTQINMDEDMEFLISSGVLPGKHEQEMIEIYVPEGKINLKKKQGKNGPNDGLSEIFDEVKQKNLEKQIETEIRLKTSQYVKEGDLDKYLDALEKYPTEKAIDMDFFIYLVDKYKDLSIDEIDKIDEGNYNQKIEDYCSENPSKCSNQWIKQNGSWIKFNFKQEAQNSKAKYIDALRRVKKTSGGKQYNNIDILSYNLSWGCMTPSNKNNSVKKLSQYCVEKTKNKKTSICLENALKIIDDNENPYSFIGLQEASKYYILIKKSKKLQEMKYIHSNTLNNNLGENLITFYNQRKYKLLFFKTDTLLKNDRPVHILFFKNQINNTNLILINLHSYHYTNNENKKLNKILSDLLDIKNNILGTIIDEKIKPKNFKNNINKQIINEKILDLKNPNIIIMGDWNDHKKYNYWKSFKPFEYTKINEIKNIIVKSKKPPNTCCVGKKSLRPDSKDKLYGDYILISDNLKFKKENFIPKKYNLFNAYKFPTSDHLPIKAIICFRSKSLKKNRKKKYKTKKK